MPMYVVVCEGRLVETIVAEGAAGARDRQMEPGELFVKVGDATAVVRRYSPIPPGVGSGDDN